MLQTFARAVVRFEVNRLVGCCLTGISLALLLAGFVQAEQLPVKVYTSADGLGSGFVNYLMRDSRGFMWFCTRDGLSRFDGARFVTYRVGGSNAAPGIEAITETTDGSYWITTTIGLYRFKRDAISQPNPTNGSRPTLNAEFIHNTRGGLIEDRKGNLWYHADGLYRVEEKDGKVAFQKVELNLPAASGNALTINGIAEADDGSLWLNSSLGLVRRLPDGRVILYASKTAVARDYRSFLFDWNGRLWFARQFELYVFIPEMLDTLANLGAVTVRALKPTYRLPAKIEKEIHLPEKAGEMLLFTAGDFLSQHPANRLCQTADNHIWLTANRELLEFDGRVFHRYTAAQGLSSSMATVAEDAAGNLWIAGRRALLRLDRKGLISYGEDDGFHSASIHAINEAKDGALYFADSDFYLLRYNGKTESRKQHSALSTQHSALFTAMRPALAPNPRSLWTSRYAFLDSRNEWWVLTDEKLYRFAASNLQKPLATYSSRDGLQADSMFQIFADRRGDIWLSVQSNNAEIYCLARFDRPANRFHTFTHAEGFPAGKSVSSFAEDNHGNLWLGFYEGGIARFRESRFTAFSAADGVPTGVITDLQLDRSGRLWLASTNDGLSRMDDTNAAKPDFVSLTTDDGLSSNNARTLTEDHFGNIYVGTVRGVDRISPCEKSKLQL